jgi:hypothetical protein
MLHHTLLFGLPLCLSVLIVMTLHWMPLRKRDGSREFLLACYTMGSLISIGITVCTMLIAPAVGLEPDTYFWIALLVVIAVANNLTVRLCYWIDDSKAHPISMGELENAKDIWEE